MIRLNVVAEGHTEQIFVNQVLREHFANHFEIGVVVRKIRTNATDKRTKKHSGGFVKYNHLKKDLGDWMREDQNDDVRFTTMIDLYGLPADFPGLDKAEKETNPLRKVQMLEEALKEDIADRRFIPHIQLHEFEAMLFVDPLKLVEQFPSCKNAAEELVLVSEGFSSPEDINEGKETAPSKRIIAKIPEYTKRKKYAGPDTVKLIGLNLIRQKCPHFNAWIKKLENIG